MTKVEKIPITLRYFVAKGKKRRRKIRANLFQKEYFSICHCIPFGSFKIEYSNLFPKEWYYSLN